jgi:lipopolysaccharide export system permease protein
MKMLKILDKYLIKKFLLTLLFGLIAFIFIFIIIDLMEKLDDFIDNGAGLKIALEYYFYLIPEIVRLMLPVSVLLSALFTMGKLSSTNEATAMKSSGMSFLRIAQPFIYTTVLISLFAVYFGGYVVPQANKERIYIEQKFLRIGLVRNNSNIIFQDSPTRIIMLRYFDPKQKVVSRVGIEEFDKNNSIKLVSRIDAMRMKYDKKSSSWILYDGVKREFTAAGEVSEPFIEMAINYLNFLPEDILKKQRKPAELTLSQLSDEIQDVLRAGNDPTRLEIEYHSRIAFAFASIITLLFGLPLTLNKRGGGVALEVGLNLLITFVYLAFMQISQAFGKNGSLNPFLTAWLANLLFLAGAIINIYRVQRS